MANPGTKLFDFTGNGGGKKASEDEECTDCDSDF
jgi:hypothetical protein